MQLFLYISMIYLVYKFQPFEFMASKKDFDVATNKMIYHTVLT